MNDTPTITVNLFGIAINVAYLWFFFAYTNDSKDKTVVLTQIGYAGAFLAAVIAYSYIENPEVLPFRYGLILTAVLFYFIGSPLLGIVCKTLVIIHFFPFISNKCMEFIIFRVSNLNFCHFNCFLVRLLKKIIKFLKFSCRILHYLEFSSLFHI